MYVCPKCAFEMPDTRRSKDKRCPQCGFDFGTVDSVDPADPLSAGVIRFKSFLGIHGNTLEWKFTISIYLGFLILTLFNRLLMKLFYPRLQFNLTPALITFLINAALVGALLFVFYYNPSGKPVRNAWWCGGIYGAVVLLIRSVQFHLDLMYLIYGFTYAFLLVYTCTYFLSRRKNPWVALGLGFLITEVSTGLIFNILYMIIKGGMRSLSMGNMFSNVPMGLIGTIFLLFSIWVMHKLFGIEMAQVKISPPLKKDPKTVVPAGTEKDKGFFAPEKKVLKKGALGGVILMVIAVIWFFAGMEAGYIFYYPPILFIIGLVGFLKGLFSGNIAGKKEEPSQTEDEQQEIDSRR